MGWGEGGINSEGWRGLSDRPEFPMGAQRAELGVPGRRPAGPSAPDSFSRLLLENLSYFHVGHSLVLISMIISFFLFFFFKSVVLKTHLTFVPLPPPPPRPPVSSEESGNVLRQLPDHHHHALEKERQRGPRLQCLRALLQAAQCKCLGGQPRPAPSRPGRGSRRTPLARSPFPIRVTPGLGESMLADPG